MAHHDNRDRKEDPVARQFPVNPAHRKARDVRYFERLTITLDLYVSTVPLDLP